MGLQKSPIERILVILGGDSICGFAYSYRACFFSERRLLSQDLLKWSSTATRSAGQPIGDASKVYHELLDKLVCLLLSCLLYTSPSPRDS